MTERTGSGTVLAAVAGRARGFWVYYRRYTDTAIHAAATAALTAFGLLIFIDPSFAWLAIASYVLPPAVLYAIGSDVGADRSAGTEPVDETSSSDENRPTVVDGGSDPGAGSVAGSDERNADVDADGPDLDHDGPDHDRGGPDADADGSDGDADGSDRNADADHDGVDRDTDGPDRDDDGIDSDGTDADADGVDLDSDGPDLDTDGIDCDSDGGDSDSDGSAGDADGPDLDRDG